MLLWGSSRSTSALSVKWKFFSKRRLPLWFSDTYTDPFRNNREAVALCSLEITPRIEYCDIETTLRSKSRCAQSRSLQTEPRVAIARWILDREHEPGLGEKPLMLAVDRKVDVH